MKQIALIFSFLVFISITSCNNTKKSVEPDKPSLPSAVKGVWVTNVASDALFSREKIIETVATCKKSGITDIYVVVWNGGYTLYPSKIMQDNFGTPIWDKVSGRDPLKEMVEEGHKAGLKVHAWFEFGFASSHKEPDGGHILRKYPDWKAIDNQGKLVSKNDFQWMNALKPDVQNFLKSLIIEVIQNYEVDGIQGDDRLPAMPSLGGYDNYTVELYKKEHNGQIPPADYKNPEWVQWRADKLTTFLGTLYQECKAAKPQIIVSMAPSIHPWALEEYLQDWPSWFEKEYCDYVIPQVYRYNIENYTNTLKAQLSYIKPEKIDKFYSGVLLQVDDFNPTLGYLDSMITTNRQLGVMGESFFYYEGLKKYPQYFTEEYRKK